MGGKGKSQGERGEKWGHLSPVPTCCVMVCRWLNPSPTCSCSSKLWLGSLYAWSSLQDGGKSLLSGGQGKERVDLVLGLTVDKISEC